MFLFLYFLGAYIATYYAVRAASSGKMQTAFVFAATASLTFSLAAGICLAYATTPELEWGFPPDLSIIGAHLVTLALIVVDVLVRKWRKKQRLVPAA